MKIIGIDDAGRGPVIGPMILAGVLIDKRDEGELKSLGVRDSKLLPVYSRKKIGREICRRFDNFVLSATPREIDNSSNLNYLEAVKAAMVVNKLTEGLMEEVSVIIDCPSVNLESWKADVWRLLKRKDVVSLFVEHKADFIHPAVSAASIIAKERRESEVLKIREKFGVDFGSGYPSDPKTRDFILKNYKDGRYKEIIRFSWKTVRRLSLDGGQTRLF